MTQQQPKEYTWDDLVAAIGQDFSGGQTRIGEVAERGFIRRYCEPLELDCPLHYDDGAAKQHGYRGVIAPVSMINQTLSTPPIWQPGNPTAWPTNDPDALYSRGEGEGWTAVPLPMPKTTAGFATDIEIEYLAPVYVGDVLTTRGNKLISVAVRQTSVGLGAFIILESEIHNQQGELVAKCRNGSYMYNPHPKEG